MEYFCIANHRFYFSQMTVIYRIILFHRMYDVILFPYVVALIKRIRLIYKADIAIKFDR